MWRRYGGWQEAVAGVVQPHVPPLPAVWTYRHFFVAVVWGNDPAELATFFYWVIFQPVQHRKNKREVGAQAGLAMMAFSTDTQMSSSYTGRLCLCEHENPI